MRDDYKVALENKKLPAKIAEKYENMKCGSCGKKLDYEVYVTDTACNILFKQTGYNGTQIPVCNKCFSMNIFFNDIVFVVTKFMRKFL